jgi:hypothetical protein
MTQRHPGSVTSEAQVKPFERGFVRYENFPQACSVATTYKRASPEDDHAQTNLSKYADGDEPRTERHQGHDHGEIVRSGITAVRSITASRIQHARRPIQPRATTQPAVRGDTGTNKPARIVASGIHHASMLLSQSRDVSVVGLLIAD